MGFEPTEVANVVTGDYYKHVDCDTEGCPEWRRLDATGPLLFHNAVAEVVKAGWLVFYTDAGLRTLCQGCTLKRVADSITDRQAHGVAPE